MSIYHESTSMHFQEITLLIKNIKRSLEFYQEILGLQVIEQFQNKTVLSANRKDPLIILLEDRNAIPLGITLGLYHFALLLPDRGSLAHVIKQLIDKRYPITGASDHGVSEAIYLDDPDGNGIEIYKDRLESEWPLEHGKMTMFTKPMDIESVMKELPQTPYLNISEQTIMGHLHFHVGNLKDAEEFYSKALGFQVVLNYMKSALFISDQGYHHHLGLNIWNGDAPLNGEKQVGLKSYVLVVPKENYPAFTRRLQDHRVTILVDEHYKYLLDPLEQRIIIRVL
ncbi:MAG TPA: glyoxalase [Acholeplasmataceae bacterium]|nr:glyoxalase [Acholeplasmataceae bacterium]